jgi:SNF2 family DNA or RNA helicase
VELTALQKKYYRAILERNRAFLYKGCRGSNTPKLVNVMMQLRKLCNHPFLIEGVEDKALQETLGADKDSITNDQYLDALVQASGKLVLLEKLLPKLKKGGHQVLISLVTLL